MLIHCTLPRRRAWMQIHCPLPRQRGQDHRILPSLPSACGHASRSDGFVRGYVQQQRAGCKSTAHFQDDGRAWMHIHYPLPGQRGQDRKNRSAMGWMQSTRAVFCDPASVAPAAGAVDPRPCPSSWKRGLSHGHRATAALRLFFRQAKPFVCQVYCLERACSRAEAFSSLERFYEHIADHGDNNFFFMLALPPTAPSLLLF